MNLVLILVFQNRG